MTSRKEKHCDFRLRAVGESGAVSVSYPSVTFFELIFLNIEASGWFLFEQIGTKSFSDKVSDMIIISKTKGSFSSI